MFVVASAESRGPAPAATVEHDATGTLDFTTTLSETSTTSTHTAVGGTDCVVLVGVAYASAATATVPTVTYGGNAMTHLGGGLMIASNAGWVRLFYLFNPPTGSRGITVTYANTSRAVHSSISFRGVASLGTAVVVPATGSGSTTSTATVTSVTANDMVVSAHGINHATINMNAYNRTQRAFGEATATSPAALMMGDTGTAGSVTGSVAMTATCSGSVVNKCAVAVRLIH